MILKKIILKNLKKFHFQKKIKSLESDIKNLSNSYIEKATNLILKLTAMENNCNNKGKKQKKE